MRRKLTTGDILKVLVLDDEEDFLKQAEVFLGRENGLDLKTSTSFKEGLKALEDNGFDAIVSDFKMPEMDGLEFLKIIREEKERDIPFIILTGKGNEEVAMEALNRGANRYLRKEGGVGIMFKRLRNAIENEVENYRTRERKEFLHSLLMHDLLNKMQAIGFYHELVKEVDSTEEKEEKIQKAETARNQCVELLEKIRTLEKIGKEEVKEVRIDLLMDEIIEQKEIPASLEDIDIESKDLGFSVIGGKLLEDLFSNLIENSIRHSDGDEISISAEERDDWVVVTVEDDGKGIPSEKKEKIFKRGYKKKSSGSGLGLYLIKEIAESYGGFVEVKDSDLGGARFDVYLKAV